jgi:hypothetical protein
MIDVVYIAANKLFIFRGIERENKLYRAFGCGIGLILIFVFVHIQNTISHWNIICSTESQTITT